MLMYRLIVVNPGAIASNLGPGLGIFSSKFIGYHKLTVQKSQLRRTAVLYCVLYCMPLGDLATYWELRGQLIYGHDGSQPDCESSVPEHPLPG